MKYDAGIILGHFGWWFGLSSRQKKRLGIGIELFKAGKIKYIITTGGFGLFNLTSIPLAEQCKEYLVRKGMRKNKVFSEPKSKNTYQNARFTLEIMREHGMESAIVVTSAFHINRAKRVFREVFPSKYRLSFENSDYISGLWTVWDYLWNTAAWIKYSLKNL